MMLSPAKRAEIKRRAMQEFKRYWLLTAYLAVYLVSFTTYRRLILAQHSISYFNFGYSLFEAMVLAKVVMVGEFLGIGDKFRNRPLIYPAVWRAMVFGVFVFIFSFCEVMIVELIQGESFRTAYRDIWAQHLYDKLAVSLVIFVAVIPLFAFNELGLVVGTDKLAGIFFRQRSTSLTPDSPPPASPAH
jgi:hypothetical protein